VEVRYGASGPRRRSTMPVPTTSTVTAAPVSRRFEMRMASF
jgi:hypothetical protein